MIKNILGVTLLSAISIIFNGCLSDDDGNSIFESSTSSSTTGNGSIYVTQTENADKITIKWKKSISYYSGYSQLEVSNSIDSKDKIVSTNSSSEVTINCVKSYATGSSNRYKCTNNQTTYTEYFELSNTEYNYLIERAGVSSSSETKQIAKIYLKNIGDTKYTVEYE